jgi:hypothetical protein
VPDQIWDEAADRYDELGPAGMIEEAAGTTWS